jgi:hypothetical protein
VGPTEKRPDRASPAGTVNGRKLPLNALAIHYRARIDTTN